jgi:UDP-GlcNAc:undecaprenyl-phosphate GlcNAc-1-phosphate transferase
LLVLSPWTKLFGEIASFLLLIILGNIRITSMHGFLGIHELPYIASVLITLVSGLGIINAMNLVDGIDGLAASLSAIITVTFGAWFFLNGLTSLLESSLPGRAIYSIQAAPAVAMGILAIPIFDTLRVFWIRILRKQSPSTPTSSISITSSSKQASHIKKPPSPLSSPTCSLLSSPSPSSCSPPTSSTSSWCCWPSAS